MRKFSPREINHLRKFAKPDSWLEVSQTSIPVEYITGVAEFCGREFKVTPDVLIPRIETEQLVDEAKNIIISYSLFPTPYPISIADIGTGCGCVGITLYLELIKLGFRPTVYLSDISEKALKVAEENVFRLTGIQKVGPWAKPRSDLIILTSDLFLGYPKDLKFDLIVANLPYIPSGRIPKLPESVKNFEPRLALDGGLDGLRLTQKLIGQSLFRLKSNGSLLLEIDETHVLPDFNVPRNFHSKIIKDQFGKNRFIEIRRLEEDLLLIGGDLLLQSML